MSLQGTIIVALHFLFCINYERNQTLSYTKAELKNCSFYSLVFLLLLISTSFLIPLFKITISGVLPFPIGDFLERLLVIIRTSGYSYGELYGVGYRCWFNWCDFVSV